MFVNSKYYVSRYLPVIILPAILAIVGLSLLFIYAQSNYFPQIQIDWSTGSELDVVGYNILRSNSPDGDLILLNQAVIAAEDPLSGGQYQYIDRDVVPGITYDYWLEAIATDGSSEKHGPIEATCKALHLFVLILALLLLASAPILFYTFRKKQWGKETSG